MDQPTLKATLLLPLLVLAGAGSVRARAAEAPARPAPAAQAGETPAKPAPPGPDEQVAAMESSCAASAAARAARHAQTSLYERLRRDEGIHALTREVVRLHQRNPAIRGLFEKADPDAVARHVGAFIISGTGGPKVYQGPDLTTSHRGMRLTNADFVSAGGDVVQAMKNLKYGQDEIDEVVCTLVALRPQVVLSASQEVGR